MGLGALDAGPRGELTGGLTGSINTGSINGGVDGGQTGGLTGSIKGGYGFIGNDGEEEEGLGVEGGWGMEEGTI